MEHFLLNVLDRAAAKAGATITVEPEFKRAGFIEYEDGRRIFFKGTTFDVNGAGAAQIARDKDYTSKFLAMAGINSVVGTLCCAPRYIEEMERKNRAVAVRLSSYEEALYFAQQHGFPLFVKPNESSEGDGIRLVWKVDELLSHLSRLFEVHDRVLVQERAAGNDYRIVVLDDAVISAYQRRPLSVCGDGHSSIRELLDKVSAELRRSGRNPGMTINADAVRDHTHALGIEIDSVPHAGVTVPLLPNANLSMGGAVLDVTERVCDEFREVAVRATNAVGLRLAGVDLLSEQIEQYDPDYQVLEVNSAPGLNNFGSVGERQNSVVHELYERLVAAMGRKR